MNSTRRRIALILTMAMVFTSVPLAGNRVNAEILPELTEVAGSNETEPEYIEGDVIVCINTGESQSPDSGVASDKAAVIAGLLDDAEDLMDVTEAVKDSEEFKTAGDTDFPDNKPENDKAASDEEYILKFIHSETYSTDRLIEMLEADPDVLFAEPNYIYHLADEIEEDTLVEDEEADRIRTGTAQTDKDSDTVVIEETRKNASAEIEAEETDIPESVMEESGEDIPADKTGSIDAAIDLTGFQYAYGTKAGEMDVPYWNTEGYKNAENTVVAVLDTGVNYNHEDLKEVMWDDGLLYPELTALGGGRYGFNGMDSKSTGEAYLSYDPMDDNIHGTHCAGSVGAPWNGYGVSGTANGTEIMAVKVADENGSFPTASVLKGFNYIKTAKEAGVNVVAVNNSWGGEVYTNGDQLAIRELAKLNVICCFAAGNETSNIDYVYSTATNLRENNGVIGVEANEPGGAKCDFSNYGVRTVDVAAPGFLIMSTVAPGKGYPDPDTSFPVKDANGTEVKDVFTDTENTYFTYAAANGAASGFMEDHGKNALTISNIPDGKEFLTISSDKVLLEKPGYFGISARYEKSKVLSLSVNVLLDNGEYETLSSKDPLGTRYSAANNIYALPDDMELENPQIVLSANFEEPDTGKMMFIRGITFTSELTDYAYFSGTSMATPAVTGEVAVVASKWPNDSAEKRAARVIGSTKEEAVQKGLTRTEGIANVRKALECDYVPVVNTAWTDGDGKLNISGYFFGDDIGDVTITAGESTITGLSITQWKGQSKSQWDEDGKNEEDIIRLDPGSVKLPDSEIKVTVTSTEGKTGSRFLSIKGTGDFAPGGSCYEKLPVPTEVEGDLYKSFLRTRFLESAAVNGAIYYTGLEMMEAGDYYTFWKYTLSQDNITPAWQRRSIPLYAGRSANICAWNGMLVYVDERDEKIHLYDPEKDIIYDTGFALPEMQQGRWSRAEFLNADGRLYLLVTFREMNDVGKYVDDRTELYRIDLQNRTSYRLCKLETVPNISAMTVSVDGTGSDIIYALEQKGDTHVTREMITVSGDNAVSESKELALPGNCRIDGEIIKGAGNQYGIVFAGPVDEKNNADNFLYSYKDDSIIECSKSITAGRPGRTLVTEYRGHTYFLCIDNYSENGETFACADDDEFKGSGPAKEPLPCYGDDKYGDVSDIKGVVYLKAQNNGYVAVGKSIKVTPEYTGMDGKEITYTWYSDDANIATVDQTGKVTGKSAGNTSIHVVGRDTAGNEYEGVCGVGVYPVITEIKLNTKKLSVAPGSEFTIEASLTPGDALTDEVEWVVDISESYPGLVERIDEGYRGTGCYVSFRVGDPGKKLQFKITAKATDGSKKKATCLVTIDPKKTEPVEASVPVKSAALSDTGTIYLGEDMEYEILLVRVKPVNSSEYTVEWKSSSPAVTVSGNEADPGRAVIKADKKGTAKITAVIKNLAPGGKKTVTVKGLTVKVAGSALSGNAVKIFNKNKDITGTISGNRLAVGKKMTLKAPVYLNGKRLKAGKVKVIWTSSDPEVATVVNGKVKAYREGSTTITVTLIPSDSANRDFVTASCELYVYNPIKKLSPLVKNVKVPSGETTYLGVRPTIAPTGEGDTIREEKDYIWSSSNTNVVDIQDEGGGFARLTAKKAGKAVITCKAKDGSKKTAKFKVTVYDRVTGITISVKKPGALTVSGNNTGEMTVSGLANKKTFTISPKIEPATASNKAVVYTSSNPAAVTVSKKGVVKRVGVEAADIYVTTVDGGYMAVCHVVE